MISEYFRPGEIPVYLAMKTWKLASWNELFTPVEGYFMTNFNNPQATQRFVLALICILANCSVLKYHFTEAPHPKFLMHWRRKYSIKAHIACGTLEMACTVFAMASQLPIFALLVALFCFGHVLTSAYLMSGLFGLRNLMVPCYGWAVGCHCMKGVILLGHVKETEACIIVFLTLQIYVWVRVAYTWLERIGIMRQYQYTLSVMIAGLIILPSVLAESILANWLTVAFIAIWNALPPCRKCCCPHAYPRVDDEGDFSLNSAEINRENYTLMKKHHAHQDARFHMKKFGTQVSLASGGTIATLKSSGSAHSSGAHSSLGAILKSHSNLPFKRLGTGGSVSLDTGFYQALVLQSSAENVHEECPYNSQKVMLERVKSVSLDEQRQIAHAIFENLCFCPGEGMTTRDMEELLAVWGLPYREAEYVFSELKPNLENPDVISFDEFFEHLPHVWMYALTVMEDQEKAWGKIFALDSIYRTDTDKELKSPEDGQ